LGAVSAVHGVMGIPYRMILITALVCASSAWGENPFTSCKAYQEPVRFSHGRNPIPESLKPGLLAGRSALDQAVAGTLSEYLRTGEQDLGGLLTWLEPITAWEEVKSCHKNGACGFLIAILPVVHKELRMRLALALATDPLSSELWNLAKAGNPDLRLMATGLEIEKREPLSAREKAMATQDLLNFWDGEAGVIENYMAVLRRKIELTRNIALMPQNLRDLLARFEQTRKFPSAQDRVEKAFAIGDQGWVLYRQIQFEKMQHAEIARIWQLIDQIRPLIYLPQGMPTPMDVRRALQKSIADNRNFQDKLVNMEAASRLKWLMSRYPQFVERTLAHRPELCGPATEFQRKLDQQEFLLTTGIAVAIGLPLVALAPPVATALGPLAIKGLVLGSLGAQGFLAFQEHRDYKQLQEEYLARWSHVLGESLWVDSSVLAYSEHRVLLSSAGFLAVGLPMVKPVGLLNHVYRIFAP
jgi:hypothetical protein